MRFRSLERCCPFLRRSVTYGMIEDRRWKRYDRDVRWPLLFCCVSTAFGQLGTQPKPKAEDYEVHAKAGDVAIGAEFMVHSFSGDGVTYIAKDFLVVQIALYLPK